jgi:hypothetical protein
VNNIMCVWSGGIDGLCLGGLRKYWEIFLLRRKRDLCGTGDVMGFGEIIITQ